MDAQFVVLGGWWSLLCFDLCLLFVCCGFCLVVEVLFSVLFGWVVFVCFGLSLWVWFGLVGGLDCFVVYLVWV